LGKQTIVKERFAKQYRHPVLDERINTRRLHSVGYSIIFKTLSVPDYNLYIFFVFSYFFSPQEARMLNRARKAGVDAPCIYFIDEQNKLLYMEKIDGVTAKQYIWDHAATGLQPNGTLLPSI